MSDGIVVNKDATLAAVAGLRQTADSLDAAHQEFSGRVQGLVEHPGNDMISPLIWAAHDAVFQILAQCVSSNSGGIRAHADKWATAQEVHDMVEQANVGEFNRIRGTLL